MAARDHVHWVDWLKVLAVFGVFVYHSAMVYAYVPWVVSNDDHSILLSLFAGAGFSMGMPLLFVLSGAAAFFALRKLAASHFIELRFRRLVIPMVVGLLLLSPFQAYLALASRRAPAASLYQYYPQFFSGMDVYFSPRWLGNYGYHLWFLGFLFLYSVIALPFFVWLGRPIGRRFSDWLAGVCLRPGGLLVFVAPPALAQMALRARYPWYGDWADFTYWLLFFAAGYVIVADARFQRAIVDHWKGALGSVAVSAAGLGLYALSGRASAFEAHPEYSAWYGGYVVLRTVNTWSMVLLVLALGIRHLDRASALITHADEAVLPFYVLHHPVVVGVAFLVIQLDAGMWMKFVLQTLAAFVITAGAYELLIRPFDPVRELFGLRPRRASGGPAAQLRRVPA